MNYFAHMVLWRIPIVDDWRIDRFVDRQPGLKLGR